MATSFFNSWALWEKMTFVLALAILAVFGIGYGKLVWRNNLVRKQELMDEEKQMRIEELRMSGQIMESRRSQDTPFGVRAIQSGIQVDGIWISKDSTPTPESLKLNHLRKTSTDITVNSNYSPRASLDTPQEPAHPSSSSRGGSLFRGSESGWLPFDRRSGIQDFKSTEGQDVSGYRSSYQPRRSSHLRYGSQGIICDEYTLDQLEGKLIDKDVSTSQCNAARREENEGDLSSGAAADNEQSSGSDTDATLSVTTQAKPRGQSSVAQYSIATPSLLKSASGTQSQLFRASFPLHSWKTAYSSIPLEPPERESSNLFRNPLSSPTEAPPTLRPPYVQDSREFTTTGESQVPLLLKSRTPSPFIPGELHMNKTVRKVNSGFEVLPAGTFFGLPSDFKEQTVNGEERRNSIGGLGEKRHSNKLQKKIRSSTSSRGPSSTIERL